MVQMDMLSFVAMADESLGLPFSRQTHAKCHDPNNAEDRVYDIVTPIDPAVGVGQWKYIKNAKGFPWDLKLYDDANIFDWITEKTWEAGPRSFKKFVGNHTGPDGKPADGMVQLPRQVYSKNNKWVWPIVAESTTYATFDNCIQSGKPTSLGAVEQVVTGPFMIDHGGDIGNQPTMIQQYYWTNTVNNKLVPTLEENYFALYYGWVTWKLQALDPGTQLYVLENETVNNRLVPVTSVPFDFPCF